VTRGPAARPRTIGGRYSVFEAIETGGLATVHLGCLKGDAGFARVVAVKLLHPHRAEDVELVKTLVVEAKRAARVRHPSVVPLLDVIAEAGEVALVMDYVPGETLARLTQSIRKRNEAVAPSIATAIVSDLLGGLQAAHDARDEHDAPMGLLHRDVAPESVLVGVDGVARLLKLGVAKAIDDTRTTQHGILDAKRRMAHVPPERLHGKPASRASDVYGTGVILWELLTGKRLFQRDDEVAMLSAILEGKVPRPSQVTQGDSLEVRVLDDLVLRATSLDPESRFASANEMQAELERLVPLASRTDVAKWVERNGGDALATRAHRVAEIERGSVSDVRAGSVPDASGPRMTASRSARLVFGLVVPPTESSDLAVEVDRLVSWIADHVGIAVERRDALSYEALATDVREGRIDIAWLPPIVYVRLADGVVALGSVRREGKTAYEAALVVRADSRFRTIDALKGTRAGWVDPWSASGFVLPRMKLALLGIDPRTLFRTETFHGTHAKAIEALRDGACDVAGTYARADAEGAVSSGAWSTVDGASVRVLATFGAIPPDVVAARAEVPAETRASVLEAIRAPEMKDVLRAIFGGDEIDEGIASGYEALRKALEMAAVRGLFD
jgi:phosphate/phosphite/phosphonate ABC transporter binding protein